MDLELVIGTSQAHRRCISAEICPCTDELITCIALGLSFELFEQVVFGAARLFEMSEMIPFGNKSLS